MRRRFSRRQRKILALLSGNACAECAGSLTGGFHADHRHPFSRGGPTILSNGQALCAKCNLKKGNKMFNFRPWQQAARDKALRWYAGSPENRHFLINAAPGAGKTLTACAVADALLKQGEIDRVVVIAPRSAVVAQWAREFMAMTGRHMARVTGGDHDLEDIGADYCATWSVIASLADGFQALCRTGNVLVICDEHHHAADGAAWGDGAHAAFAEARRVIVLTGTPIRSDGAQSVWLAQDEFGGIGHAADGTFTLTYGQAVDLGYCRPVTFHRHEGRFRVDLEQGGTLTVSGTEPAEVCSSHPAARALQRSLDFYKLARVPQYMADGRTPRADGYQATMVEWANDKLNDLRDRMPNAGGLIIASSIELADYFAKLVEMIDGKRPVVVHSAMRNAESRIEAFRKSSARWIVSVGMVAEGVDIPRLRVLVYLPSALTELAFRQAIGRIVRANGPRDDTRAYVVMPAFAVLEEYARRVEAEMPPPGTLLEASRLKRCPVCQGENAPGASSCEHCDHEFPIRATKMRICPGCGSFNPAGLSACQACGISFDQDFTLTLDEALRLGAIARGVDISEERVREAERLAPAFRDALSKVDDPLLGQFLRSLPEECVPKLRDLVTLLEDRG